MPLKPDPEILKSATESILITLRYSKEDNGDYCNEWGHIEADRDLCDLLTKLGYERIVKIYNKIPKAYA
jgi:hypothetical protein